MAEYNLYWSVYKNLEKEVLEITQYVHLSDDQLGVYSMHIADLIVRCAVEIESLAKELYWKNGGVKVYDVNTGNERDLYFDTDCLKFLNDIWGICKKKILVSCINMYLDKEENKIITPLHKANKRGTSGAIWNKAYQAVKHDRKNSLNKATIKNLIHALGALYILNLYYKDEVFKVNSPNLSKPVFDDRLGSDIFAVTYADASKSSIGEDMTDNAINEEERKKLETSICIIKYTETAWKEMHKEFEEFNNRIALRTLKSPEVKEFIEKNPEYKPNNLIELLEKAGGTELVRKILSSEVRQSLVNGQKEVVLNKAQVIYQ